MTTPQAVIAAFVIAALIAAALYFIVIYRRATKGIAEHATRHQGERAYTVGADQPQKPGLAARLNYILFTDKHPHFDPRDSHNHTAPHNGSTNPTATGANGGYYGGGAF